MMELPRIGAKLFIPEIYQYLNAQPSLESWSPEPELFLVLLLSLIVNRGGVIVDISLRESSKDKNKRGRDEKQNVGGHIIAVMQGIFGHECRRIDLSGSTRENQLEALITGERTVQDGGHGFPMHSFAPTSQADEKAAPCIASSFITPQSRPRWLAKKGSNLTNGSSTQASSRYASARSVILDEDEHGMGQSGVDPTRRGTLTEGSRSSTARGFDYGSNPGTDAQDGGEGSHTPRNAFTTSDSSRVGETLPVRLPVQESQGDNESPHSPSSRWPGVLLVSGLEDASSPTQIRFCELVKRSQVTAKRSDREHVHGEIEPEESTSSRGMLVIWLRDKEKSAKCTSWLTDGYLLSLAVAPGLIGPALPLPNQAVIPHEYIANLQSLLPFTHLHPPLRLHIQNITSAIINHPNLRSSLTSTFITNFPRIVQAHRLLAGDFHLPVSWGMGLKKMSEDGDPDSGDFGTGIIAGNDLGGTSGTGRFGISGGRGGVDGWAWKAGEEPTLRELAILSGDASWLHTVGGEEEGKGLEEWFASPDSVSAVAEYSIRHRIKWRGMDEGIMWLWQTSAFDLSGKATEQENELSPAAKARMAGKVERRKSREVDRILRGIVSSV